MYSEQVPQVSDDRRGATRQRWLLILLLLAGLGLRLVGLNSAPPGLRYDELQNYRMVSRVLAGERPLYFTESWGHEPLFHYVQAAVVALLTESGWAMRLPAVFSGMVAILGVWLVARRLFGWQVALVAAAGQTFSFWAIFYSRVGLRLGTTVPFFCLMALFLWLAMTRTGRRGWIAAVVSGFLLAGMIYVYPSGRMGPVFVAAFGLYLALWHRTRFRQVWPRLLCLLLLGGLVAAPLLNYLRQHPSQEQRGEQLAAPALALLQEGDPRPLLAQVGRAAGMFVWQGEEDWLYNVEGRPIFDPLSAVFFLAGVVFCLYQWRRPAYAFVLLWLLVGMIPTVLTLPAASITHSIVAQPAAHVILAVGIWGLLRIAYSVLPERSAIRNTQYAIPAFVIAVYAILSFRAYFQVWAEHPAVGELYQGGITAVANDLTVSPPSGPVVIGGPYIDYWQPWNAVAFELSNPPDDVAVRWFNPAGAWVWPAGNEPTTYYFPAAPLGPQTFNPLLRSWYWQTMADELANLEGGGFKSIRIATLTNSEEQWEQAAAGVGFSWPPELADLPPAEPPLIFGGRFALVGVEVVEPTISAGGVLQLLTYWQVEAADPAPVVAFVHVTDDQANIWGQQDWLDVRAAGLLPGDRFVQVHSVTLKPETPAGRYLIHLGLYAPDTLARLPIDTGTERTADRVVVGEVQVEE